MNVRLTVTACLDGLRPAYRQDNLVVYEAALIGGLGLRQRLALVDTAGQLDAATLVIGFTDNANPSSMASDYARVRDRLLQRYGPPQVSRESGLFKANLNAEMAMGRFERSLEWRTQGGLLRFGVPRRLDGQVRMEVVHATSLPPGSDWGLEALR